MFKLIKAIKKWLKIKSFLQQYANSQGFEIVEISNTSFDLYCDDSNLVGNFPTELAASSEIYYLVAARKNAENSGGW